jgi:thioredoxin reductase
VSAPTHAADVLIIGGGAGGMSCAITLASAQKKNWFENRRVIIVDDGTSDLRKARLYNAPGVEPGLLGEDLLIRLEAQLHQYDCAATLPGTVQRAERLPNGAPTCTTRLDSRFTGKFPSLLRPGSEMSCEDRRR